MEVGVGTQKIIIHYSMMPMDIQLRGQETIPTSQKLINIFIETIEVIKWV